MSQQELQEPMENNEQSAFDGFKFKLGDIVAHIADKRDEGAHYVVIHRALIESPAGISRQYSLTGVGDGTFTAYEIEMRHTTI